MATAVAAGRVVAESDETKTVEGNLYFPAEGVESSYLTPSNTEYTCPWKGEATYYHLTIDGRTLQDAAWSYHEPKPAATQISGHFAFDSSKGVDVREEQRSDR